MANEPAPTSNISQTISFRDLKLRAGLALQAHCAVSGEQKGEAQFLAAVAHKGVMVGPHSSGDSIRLHTGAEYTIKGFTGQYDFTFSSSALQAFEKPFPYTLLEYPTTVNARLVRRAMRIKSSLPAKAVPTGHDHALDVTLVDVSSCGAMVRTAVSLGGFGDTIRLTLPIPFEGEVVNLTIPSTICHSYRTEHHDGIHVGLAFKPGSRDDKLMLHFLALSSNDERI